MAKKKGTDFYEELEENFAEYVKTRDDVEDVKSISTGILSLDVSLRIGGIPMKKFTQIYGAEGVGKTTLALSIAKNAIEKGYNVLYVDAEQAVDPYAAEHVIGPVIEEPGRFVHLQPEVMEHALRLCEDAIRDKKQTFGLIILDSIASMTPIKVYEDSLEDSNPYILSRKMTTFCQRNAYAIRKYDVAFVGINQVRDDTSNSYIRQFMAPGGHMWKHMLALDIQLSKSAQIKQGEDTIGINAKFLVKKSKISPPFRSFTFPIMFGDGYAYIDYYRDVVEFANTLGVIHTAGAYYKFGDVTLGRGMVDAMEYLKNEKDALDNLEKMCYNALNSKNYVEEV